MSKIDFVITWVDGSDPQWIAQKNQYDVTRVESSSLEANSTCRYRCDAELLRYWFRSVEAFAPWVNAIFFITCGQKPEWLNENHPKLRIVNHEDYIPERYLPTFNSNTIELNVHRIAELSEQFVLFNDDMFLLRPVGPDFFYNHGNPVLATDLRYPRAVGYNNWSRLLFNDYCVLQRSFNVRKSIWGNRNKWFSPCKLGIKRSRQNFICYLANKTIPVGIYGHLIQPHLKSTLEAIWSMHPDVLHTTCAHRFRSDEQVNQYLLCAWNQAAGRFYPAHESSLGQLIELMPDHMEWTDRAIREQRYAQVCLNDSPDNSDPDYCSEVILKAFQSILPRESGFEK